MSIATQDEEPVKPRRAEAVKLGRALYGHVTTILATFGLAKVAEYWLGIDWRGFLNTLVGVWDETVRPVVERAFHFLVTVPLGWIGLHFEVPLWFRDYVSVGIILALSHLRTARGPKGSSALESALFPGLHEGSRLRQLPWPWVGLGIAYLVAFWPIAPGVAALMLFAQAYRSSFHVTQWNRTLEDFKAFAEGPLRTHRGSSREDMERALSFNAHVRKEAERYVAEFSALKVQVRRGVVGFVLLISPLLYLGLLLAANYLAR